MPIYEYQCSKCGHLEIFQRITEKPLLRCPTCQGKVTKLISQSSFHLKGSGWYMTDYARKGGSETKSASDKKGSSDTSSAKEGDKATSTESSDRSSSPTKDSGGSATKESGSSSPASGKMSGAGSAAV
jgi:putative FmdB family regulatory protein